MGARSCLLVYADGSPAAALTAHPVLDRDATVSLVHALFPSAKLDELEPVSLLDIFPDKRDIHAGCFNGVAIVAAHDFGIDKPSRLPARFLDAAPFQHTWMHAMHSVVDWFAFAHWEAGVLRRALSVAPDNGIIEDLGARLPFEQPFWSAASAGDDELPFHPLDFGDAALGQTLGFQIEGYEDGKMLDPATIPLLRFRQRRPWWKVW